GGGVVVVVVVEAMKTVVGGTVVVVVVVTQVPSAAQASNLLKNPCDAPQAVPFLHFVSDLTIDALTFPLFFRTQQTAAFKFPQMDAFSHFMMSLRHGFWGMRAVRFASFSVRFTHFLYVPCVWPSRVQPHVFWMVSRAFSMDAASVHFALVHSAKTGVTAAGSSSSATAPDQVQCRIMVPPPGPNVMNAPSYWVFCRRSGRTDGAGAS